ncbi:MAG: RluA family pseudouridine synthase [Bacteroidetes bacterium]|nr:RluA family pseudouridine synthase [Bacteroidota bacterium]
MKTSFKPEVLYEDKALIIVNKPAGLLVIPDRFDSTQPSLNKLLEEKYQRRIFVVHRLDRDTSGAICFAKTESSHQYLSTLFQKHEIIKRYTGLVVGQVMPDNGRIETPIIEHPFVKGKMTTAKKGKPSITDYQVVEQWPLYALVQFQIHTGRTHQIRVHMQSIGHPIVCDELYGNGKPLYLSSFKKKYKASHQEEAERPLLSRLALHSYELSFVNEEGIQISVQAPLPKDISACINQLNKWTKAKF